MREYLGENDVKLVIEIVDNCELVDLINDLTKLDKIVRVREMRLGIRVYGSGKCFDSYLSTVKEDFIPESAKFFVKQILKDNKEKILQETTLHPETRKHLLHIIEDMEETKNE